MEDSIRHKILIVDDNDAEKEIFRNVLTTPRIEKEFAVSGEAGLELIKSQEQPFSVIISEQEIAGMKGTQFLEHVRQIHPHTSLFLMADQADVNAITTVVNNGIIQRYITKPLNPEQVAAMIQTGIEMFESLTENEKLLTLAKNQNTKLYDLSCNLMETAKSHNKTAVKLDEEIELLKRQIQEISDKPPVKPDILSPQIIDYITQNGKVSPEKIYALFSETIRTLHVRFTETAYRNGFEMPDIKNGSKT